MAGEDLASLVKAAQAGNEESRRALLEAARPFVRRVAEAACRRRLEWENDDELSVALIAFNEAVDTYAVGRGARFETYAAAVIRHRLVDYFRQEAPHRRVLSLDAPRAGEAGSTGTPAPLAAAAERLPSGGWTPDPLANSAEAIAERADEIRRYAAHLARFGLTLADLRRAAPQHRDTRERLVAIARHLAADPELSARFLTQRRLPLADLAAATGASRKVLDSGRRYITGVALLLLAEDLDGLRSFAGLDRPDPSRRERGDAP